MPFAVEQKSGRWYLANRKNEEEDVRRRHRRGILLLGEFPGKLDATIDIKPIGPPTMWKIVGGRGWLAVKLEWD